MNAHLVAPLARAAVLAAAAIALLACEKKTFTEPDYLYSNIGVSARFRNANGSATLLSYQTFLDGTPLSPVQIPGVPIAETKAGGSLVQLAAGPHVFSVTVLAQTESPSPYVLSDIRITRLDSVSGSAVETRSWNVDVPATLATGESVAFTVYY